MSSSRTSASSTNSSISSRPGAYEANSKVVKAADDMYQQVNNLTK